MSEEILKIALAELLKTIRLHHPDGSIVEISGVDKARHYCEQAIQQHRMDNHAGQILIRMFKALEETLPKEFPIGVEFAVVVDK